MGYVLDIKVVIWHSIHVQEKYDGFSIVLFGHIFM